jgi:Flp pilus assembly pilin Flp
MSTGVRPEPTEVVRDMRRALHRDDTGASAVEYSMVVVGIAAVLVLAILFLGRMVSGTFGSLDCWTATGCTQSMSSTESPAPATSTAADAVIPASAYAGNQGEDAGDETTPTTVVSGPLCNKSGNGNGKGQGQGNCGR